MKVTYELELRDESAPFITQAAAMLERHVIALRTEMAGGQAVSCVGHEDRVGASVLRVVRVSD